MILCYDPLKFLSARETLDMVLKAFKFTPCVGILLHHIYLNADFYSEIRELLDEVKRLDLTCVKMSEIRRN